VSGRDCNGYQVWGKMSSGGMGDVWLARHAALALPVIVKTIRADGDATLAQAEQLMLHEARVMARLASPRVVRVLDVGHWRPDDASPELPFLIEEYVDGIDLGEHARRRRAAIGRAMPLWAAALVCAEAAVGIHAAHQAGVVHRDVKPSNLFLYGHGEVKVGDFGVAVAAGVKSAGVPAGTPAFMAPEQLRGETLDRRVDVYSLGATAFALRYGRPPRDLEVDGLGDFSPRFPPPHSPEEAYFQHVIARMMAPRRDDRYPNLMVARQYLLNVTATRPRLETARLGPGRYQIGSTTVVIEVGDIVRADADAIVTSANSELTMRTGTGDAIRRAGGDAIEEEALALGPRALGECVRTGAGSLGYADILHAVGGWNEVSCVSRATHRALHLCLERKVRRVAMPAIGTGQGRVTLESCADALIGVVVLHAGLGGLPIDEIRLVLLDDESRRRFCEVAEGLLFAAQEAPTDDPYFHADTAEDASANTVFVPTRSA
jgi:serine/threonine-protein kinase